MSTETTVALGRAPRPRPVRVKLLPSNTCDRRMAHPPQGDTKEWWQRLKAAFGTSSSDFVNATLVQIQAASKLPCGSISETGVNAALALIEGCEPRNEVEAALATQLACTHACTMAVLSRLGGAHGGDRHVAIMVSAAAKLVKAFAIQVEALRRLRSGGNQTVRVEHIHVDQGGQAAVGFIE